ncbi:MAG TPA: hypothetical protein VID28_07090 [Methylomirabilota bacterium]
MNARPREIRFAVAGDRRAAEALQLEVWWIARKHRLATGAVAVRKVTPTRRRSRAR